MTSRWIYKETLLCAWVLFAFMGPHAQACDQVYAKVGAGYKLEEENTVIIDGERYNRIHIDPYSARFELGCRNGPWTYGASHHSQWGTGWPINERREPYKTEFFIDYEWSWDLR